MRTSNGSRVEEEDSFHLVAPHVPRRRYDHEQLPLRRSRLARRGRLAEQEAYHVLGSNQIRSITHRSVHYAVAFMALALSAPARAACIFANRSDRSRHGSVATMA